MCAEQPIGRCADDDMPARNAGDTMRFAGQPARNALLKDLGCHRAAWIDPMKGTVIQIADFERPDDDPQPGFMRFDDVCPYCPTELGR